MISAKRYIWDECSSSNDLSSRIDFPGEDRDGIDSGDQSFYSPGVSWRSGNAKTMMTQTELAIIDGEDDDVDRRDSCRIIGDVHRFEV